MVGWSYGVSETPTPSVVPSPAGIDRGQGVARIVGGLLAVLCLSVVEVGVISVFAPGVDSLAARMVAQALFALTLIGIALALATPGQKPAALGSLGLRPPTRSPLLLATLAYLAYVGFAIAYGTVVQPQQEDVTRDLGYGHGGVGTIAAVLLVVTVAPVSEELFFRGFMFGGLRKRLSFLSAALIPAAVWGLLHYTGPDSVGVIPQLAFFGLVLAWVYEKSGSLWPAIGVHAANNAIAFALLT